MKLYYVRDTLQTGENSKIIQLDNYEFTNDQFNSLIFLGADSVQHYNVYSSSDSVFQWTNGSTNLFLILMPKSMILG